MEVDFPFEPLLDVDMRDPVMRAVEAVEAHDALRRSIFHRGEGPEFPVFCFLGLEEEGGLDEALLPSLDRDEIE